MSNAFQDSPGKEKAGLYADTVHPSAMGYLVWYQNIVFTPKITQIKQFYSDNFI
jgi:hypothetical protein